MQEGSRALRRGDIDAVELDELIHHYKRPTPTLSTFCMGGGAHVHSTARTLEWLREHAELPDWWEQATARRARD